MANTGAQYSYGKLANNGARYTYGLVDLVEVLRKIHYSPNFIVRRGVAWKTPNFSDLFVAASRRDNQRDNWLNR